MSNSLRAHGLQTARFLCPWNSPGKNTGVGNHFLLQGIFLTQGTNPCLPHCMQIIYYLSHLIVFVTREIQTKRNELSIDGTTWMNHKCVLLSKGNWTGKSTWCKILSIHYYEKLKTIDTVFANVWVETVNREGLVDKTLEYFTVVKLSCIILLEWKHDNMNLSNAMEF